MLFYLFSVLLLAGNNTYVLEMETCHGKHTLHGLWPEWGQWCPGPGFDPNAMPDLQAQLDIWWPACAGTMNNTEFHAHEWLKHGRCTPLNQHDYFAKGLSLRDRYGPGTQDRICLSANFSQIPCASGEEKE
jgi:ribonuclease I